jgi:CheY-like chemotaxis protein
VLGGGWMAIVTMKRVLVVACEPEICDLLKLLFSSERENYEVLCTCCAFCSADMESALARVQTFQPNLIIVSEPVNPIEDCGRIVDVLSVEPTTQNIPVIVIDDWGSTLKLTRRGRPLNVVKVYSRPVNLIVLADQVKAICYPSSPATPL